MNHVLLCVDDLFMESLTKKKRRIFVADYNNDQKQFAHSHMISK